MSLITIARGRVFNWSHQVGGRSSGQDQFGNGAPGFSKPNGIAVGKDGIVYVLDRETAFVAGFFEPRVNKVYVGGPLEEKYLMQIGGQGDGDGDFRLVSAIALDKDDNIYVADEQLQRISIFDNDGKFLGKWGTPGNGPGELNGPSGLAFDSNETLYEVDALNHRVQKFTKDGTYLGGWGSFGSGEGEFNTPWGITIDHNDHVYVVDWKNHRVQKFTTEGTFLLQIGRPAPRAGELNYPEQYPRHVDFSHLYRLDGADSGELNHPANVAVDKDGDIYVSDWANDRVQVYTPEGEFITTLWGDARQYSKWAQAQVDGNPDAIKAIRRAKHPEIAWRFKRPIGIGIDHENNRIMVTDQGRRRFQVYVKERNFIDPQFNL